MTSLTINETHHDLDIIRNGDRFTVTAGPNLRRDKWRAGVWVMYVEDESSTTSFTVEKSDGIYTAGFLIYESENYNSTHSGYRNFTSYQNTTPTSSPGGSATLTLVAGGGRFLFREFETQALNAQGQRTGGPITYSLNEELKVSENGKLCNDPDANLLVATGGQKTLVVGICCFVPTEQVPKLGLDYKY
jgi:hypothetical protein